MSDVAPSSKDLSTLPTWVWVVFGVYSDRSGSKIFGVYTKQNEAEDRAKIAKDAGATYSVNYARVPLDKAFPVDLNP